MTKHTAFAYTIYKYTVVAVAKKTPEWFSVLTQNTQLWGESLCGKESLAVKPTAFSLVGRLFGVLRLVSQLVEWQSPFQRVESQPEGSWWLPWGPVFLHGVGRRRTKLGAASVLERGAFSAAWDQRCWMLSALLDMAWSWRWWGSEMPNLNVGPLTCCA